MLTNLVLDDNYEIDMPSYGRACYAYHSDKNDINYLKKVKITSTCIKMIGVVWICKSVYDTIRKYC